MTAPIAQSVDTLAGRTSTGPFITLNFARSPTVRDMNYKTGQRWIDTSAQNAEWYLLSFESSNGVVNANWVQLGSGSATTENLQGNTGELVSPNVDNTIFVKGDISTGITFDGDLSNTLTASLEDIPNASLTNSSITLIAGAGISITNSPVSLGGSTTISATASANPVLTLSDDVSASITPSAGNIQLVGHINEQTGKFSTVVAGTNLANINPMSTGRWIIDPLGFNGTHTTFTTAIASAFSGDVIYVMPGSYIEDFTVTKSLQFVSLSTNFRGGSKVILTGKVSVLSGSIQAGFYGFQFLAVSDNSINLASANASITCQNCTFTCQGATPINLAGASTTNLYLENCYANGSGTPKFFGSTAGLIWVKNCLFNDVTAPFTASTISADSFVCYNSFISFPLSCSASATISAYYSVISNSGGAQTLITTAGTGTSLFNGCSLSSQGNATISVGSGTTVNATNNTISSLATNVFTGAGIINTGGNVCTNSSGNNVSTINHLTVI